MFQSIRQRKGQNQQAQIKITPLIDMVFILLIFFIVTTSFVSETGLNLQRPKSSTATSQEKNPLLIGIGPSGEISIAGKSVGLFSIRNIAARQLQNNPQLSAVLVTDKATPAQMIIQIMDELQAGGVSKIALATEKIR